MQRLAEFAKFKHTKFLNFLFLVLPVQLQQGLTVSMPQSAGLCLALEALMTAQQIHPSSGKSTLESGRK